MDDQPESARDWSNLPEGILSVVLRRLNDTDTDCCRLRAVCTSWRSSLSPPCPPQFPIWDNNLGSVCQSIFYLISPPIPKESSSKTSVWLTRVQELPARLGYKHKWYLQNPMFPVDVYIPMPILKAQVNLLDNRISEVARSYSLINYRDKTAAVKTVMFPSLKSGFTAENYNLLELKMFKSETKKWIIIAKGVSDIIAYEEKIYVTDLEGKLLVINRLTLQIKVIIKSNDSMERKFDGLFSYLVESCGKLYIVYKFTKAAIFYDEEMGESVDDSDFGKPLELKVFVLGSCLENGVKKYFWEPVTDLGDRVFFVSEYVTFTMTAQELGWDKGNCIIFTQEGFLGHGDVCLEDDPEGCDEIESHYYESELQMFGRYCGLYTLELRRW